MEGHGPTAAGVVSYAERLEDRSALFYSALAEQYPEHAALFGAFAREDRLSKVLLTRTYQETVTDALETGFSFGGLQLDGAIPDELWKERPAFPEAVATALKLEKAATAFYKDLAARSQTLLSTIYSAFRKIEKTREGRVAKLEVLQPKP